VRAKLNQVVVALLAAVLLFATPVMADSFNVFVAYSDNLRASGFFPTPWLGDPGVVSQSGAQTFDSGAIRIDNTDVNPLTISNFSVFFPSNSSTFTLWGTLVIPAGETGIFTQTSFPNFDTSDFGVFGGAPPANLEPNNADGNGNFNLIGGCSSNASFMTASQLASCNATVPVISFNENGTPVSFSDTGHILDTGEWDFVNNGAFGEDGNESINWNTIGGSSRGGNVPEPSSIWLLGSGLLASFTLLRKKTRKQ
jgi:PEP-CTERM motif-containing protein